MSRDRLKELKSNAKSPNPVYQEPEDELTSLLRGIGYEVPHNDTTNETRNKSLVTFLEEVDTINYEIQKFADIVRILQLFRKRQGQGENIDFNDYRDHQQLAKTSMSVIKKKLSILTIVCNKFKGSPGEIQLIKSQASALKKRFLTKLEVYQKMDVIYKSELEDEIASQTDELNTGISSSEFKPESLTLSESPMIQVQSSASSKYMKEVLMKAQQRQLELQEIEQGLLELHQMMIDLQNMVLIQDEIVDRIEDNITFSATNLEASTQHLNKAVNSSKRSRKFKLWIAALVIVVVILIIGSTVLNIYLKRH